jgi:hypothetical protein
VLFGAAIAAAETTLPCRQPQIAVSDRTLHVVCGTPSSLLIARSEDGGQTFTTPTTLDLTGHLALGMHRGPRIVALGDTLVVSAIVGEQGGGSDGDVLVWRSVDRGRHWSAPVTINRVAGSAREGLHAMAADASTVAAAWLDLREKGTTLATAVSRDGGASWDTDVVAYRSPTGTICQCCHPSLVVASGQISAMFRNEREGARDMYVIASADNGRTWTGAEKLGDGTWPLKACPMDGGGLGIDLRGSLVATWRRDQTVYLVFAGSPEVALGAGVNPTLAMTAAGPLVVWNGAEGLMLKRPDAGASLVDAHGKFAALAASPAGVVLAYERGAASVVRQLERRN